MFCLDQTMYTNVKCCNNKLKQVKIYHIYEMRQTKAQKLSWTVCWCRRIV